MDRFRDAKSLNSISPSLPNRRGKRPVTIRGPLHVQCGDYGDDIALRHLVDEVIAWPDIEAGPLPVGSADLVSLQVGENVNRRPLCFHYREGIRESSIRCANDLSCVAFGLRPLGYYPGMGRTSFLFKFWVGTARCDGCLHATRRTRGGCMSIAVLGLLQLLPEREEKELR